MKQTPQICTNMHVYNLLTASNGGLLRSFLSEENISYNSLSIRANLPGRKSFLQIKFVFSVINYFLIINKYLSDA